MTGGSSVIPWKTNMPISRRLKDTWNHQGFVACVGVEKSKFQIELDRLMSEAEEEQTNCATADSDTETNSLSMTKGLLIDEAELSGKYTYKVIT